MKNLQGGQLAVDRFLSGDAARLVVLGGDPAGKTEWQIEREIERRENEAWAREAREYYRGRRGAGTIAIFSVGGERIVAEVEDDPRMTE